MIKGVKIVLFCLAQITWCLPQNILGLIAFLRFHKSGNSKRYFNSVATYINREGASFSLGAFIFVSDFGGDEDWIKKASSHEYGHTFQSLMLGWLYMFVIGIPSAVWCNCFKSYRLKNHVHYGSFYTERWADELGKKHTGVSYQYLERPTVA